MKPTCVLVAALFVQTLTLVAGNAVAHPYNPPSRGVPEVQTTCAYTPMDRGIPDNLCAFNPPNRGYPGRTEGAGTR
jgi:hypothetical protein